MVEAYADDTKNAVDVVGIEYSVVGMGLQGTIAVDIVDIAAWEGRNSSQDEISSDAAMAVCMGYARGACHYDVARAPVAHSFAYLSWMSCRRSPTISIAT